LFPEGAVVALGGSDFGATLDGEAVELWTSFEARPGQTLRLGPTRSGARCYLCVRGGIAVKPFLGSASTHILSGLGGHEGRALRKGDVLEIGAWKGPEVGGSIRRGRVSAHWKNLRLEKVCALRRGRRAIGFRKKRSARFMRVRFAWPRSRIGWGSGWRVRV